MTKIYLAYFCHTYVYIQSNDMEIAWNIMQSVCLMWDIWSEWTIVFQSIQPSTMKCLCLLKSLDISLYIWIILVELSVPYKNIKKKVIMWLGKIQSLFVCISYCALQKTKILKMTGIVTNNQIKFCFILIYIEKLYMTIHASFHVRWIPPNNFIPFCIQEIPTIHWFGSSSYLPNNYLPQADQAFYFRANTEIYIMKHWKLEMFSSI